MADGIGLGDDSWTVFAVGLVGVGSVTPPEAPPTYCFDLGQSDHAGFALGRKQLVFERSEGSLVARMGLFSAQPVSAVVGGHFAGRHASDYLLKVTFKAEVRQNVFGGIGRRLQEVVEQFADGALVGGVIHD